MGNNTSASYIGYSGTTIGPRGVFDTVHLSIHKPLPVVFGATTSILGQYYASRRDVLSTVPSTEVPGTLTSVHGRTWTFPQKKGETLPSFGLVHAIDDVDVWNYVPTPIIDALTDALGRNMQAYVMDYYLPFY